MSNIIQTKRRQAAAIQRRTGHAARKAGAEGFLASMARQGGVPEDVTLTPAAVLQLGKQEAARQIIGDGTEVDTVSAGTLLTALDDSPTGAEKAFDEHIKEYREHRDDRPRSTDDDAVTTPRRRAHSAKLMRRMAEERLERRLEENARIAAQSECAASKARLRVRLSGGRQAELLGAHAVDRASVATLLEGGLLTGGTAKAEAEAAAAQPVQTEE